MIAAGRKVAVVGMGGAFPTCKDLNDFDRKLFAGESMIREWPKALQYPKQIRSTVAGYITEEEMNLEAIHPVPETEWPETYVDHLGRIPDMNLATADLGCVWAMIGALEAIKMAGWTTEETESEQTGVVIASGGGGNVVSRHAWHAFYELGKKTRMAGSHTVDRAMSYREAANVSCLIKNKGVCESIISACATGLGNIGYAYRLIKFGLQDRAICGGVEGTALETFIGFDAMQVLSKGFSPAESSRPFDVKRNGFVCSFGAGIVALEEYEMAKARGADILAVIDEYFNNSDGDGNMFYPSYDGQRRLWRGLMAGGNVKPDVVKVHGTATPVGDIIELVSVVESIGENGYSICAPKSQFGHMLGAAGSVEFITALLMLKNQKVLANKNSDNLNTELENFQQKPGWNGPMKPAAEYRHLISQDIVAKEINQIVCLNYGFGGTNSAMAISRDI
ncbi:MAG: beta-ketoacyl-[acyl-carrier-protein] synthase family protein [Mucilaginibacter sp.]|uniref:beta-ketoacyl-[acyl-carrier-protein] synthase family protein n=1 Tax=Mucilaginibacter sp. L3T2-6 TaxID=3062491 RepID=UPI002674D4DB|nr:beta-ketoacyl synthase N-terminal-like domain-containing protein [Mucilaginibacter sp. L3T2-6]MDO3641034.1 beta-ketoacyl synthase N-terminal-like domain-containing protein [Mucilaginibacter sp. L3T2-6]MDV6213490.1 beta-ketoacyl synthase N-terminal-like domain-containing protein [Mucilaginibacter sp. L3T2-6]